MAPTCQLSKGRRCDLVWPAIAVMKMEETYTLKMHPVTEHSRPPSTCLGHLAVWGLLVMIPLFCGFARGDQEGDFIFKPIDVGAYITAYMGPGGNVTIPNRLGGLPVLSIGLGTFNSATNLTGITIPDTVTSIGGWAFASCTGLTSVLIPPSVTSLGRSAFEECIGLTNISIPNGVRDFSFATFQGCRGLTSFTLPGNITNINNLCFYRCSGLTNITIPDSVTSMGWGVFWNCTGLKSAKLSNRMTKLISGTFYECAGLETITIPDSVVFIEQDAFSGCTGLVRVTLGNGVTSLASPAFSTCIHLMAYEVGGLNPKYSSVGGVLLNKTQTSIISYPIGAAGGYTIPKSVTAVPASAFKGCVGLTSITIPSSVTNAGGSVFADCTNLTRVVFEGDAPSTTQEGKFAFSHYATVFYHSETSGWGATFAGRPTAVLIAPPASYPDWSAAFVLAVQYPFASAENDDADGDGAANNEERLAGTDPTQAGSRLQLELAPQPGDLSEADKTPVPDGSHAIFFSSVPGLYYGAETLDTLQGVWVLQAVAVASTAQTRFVVPNPASQAFYRVVVLP